jgi:hypothetical protein
LAAVIIALFALDSGLRGNTEGMTIQLVLLIIPIAQLIFTFNSKARL